MYQSYITIQNQQSVIEINHINIEVNESGPQKAAPKETLTPIHLNSPFMFHKDFYPKPRIMLLDAELSNDSKQQLNDLLEEFSDIM